MLKSIVKFARIRIIITCFALALLGGVAGGDITPKLLLAFLMIVLWTIHANSINDFSDLTIDKINLSKAMDRPLVTKDISLQQFWIIHYISGSLMLFCSFFFGIEGVSLTLLLLVIDYIYSLKPIRITDKPIASPLLLAFAYVYYPFTLGYWSSDMTAHYLWLLTIGLFAAFLARMLLKDFRDVKGDKRFGKKTFLLRYGAKATCITSGICWLLAAVIVSASMAFALVLVITFLLGGIVVFDQLRRLATASTIAEQQKIISVIAMCANITIVVVFGYLAS